ncbi:MAG: hypothetical protein ACI9FZ_000892, partial [Bacteroidia bacterium]
SNPVGPTILAIKFNHLMAFLCLLALSSTRIKPNSLKKRQFCLLSGFNVFQMQMVNTWSTPPCGWHRL